MEFQLEALHAVAFIEFSKRNSSLSLLFIVFIILTLTSMSVIRPVIKNRLRIFRYFERFLSLLRFCQTVKQTNYTEYLARHFLKFDTCNQLTGKFSLQLQRICYDSRALFPGNEVNVRTTLHGQQFTTRFDLRRCRELLIAVLEKLQTRRFLTCAE